MKTLIPIKSKTNRVINAIEFNDSTASVLVSTIANTEIEIDVPNKATLARFVTPTGEIVYISNESNITIPTAGSIVNNNAEINPAIRVLPENGSRKLYALSALSLTFGIYFYVD